MIHMWIEKLGKKVRIDSENFLKRKNIPETLTFKSMDTLVVSK